MRTSKRRFCGTLGYDGTRYSGFQWQLNAPLTVQGAVENTLEQVIGVFTRILAAGRTDSGVHAKGQVIAFDCLWVHPIDALLRAINANLPRDIALKDLRVALPDFHPRFAAVSREYDYQFYCAPVREPVWDHTSWHLQDSLDLELMQTAADMLLGEHDFATFGDAPDGGRTIRRMMKAQFWKDDVGLQHLTLEGNAFLRHMVRRIMGTLVEVGRGSMSLEEFQEVFAAADKSQSGRMAPPHGLVLNAVRYRGETAGELVNEDQNLDAESD